MKKLRSKQKLIGAIAIILVAIILAIAITTNIIKNNSQVASEGYFTTTANANSNLVASYIKSGITIGGITGTLESLNTFDATATAEDIAWGKTAYVKGEKITGTMGSEESYYQNIIEKLNNLLELIVTAEEGLSNISRIMNDIYSEIISALSSGDANGAHQDAVNQYLSEIDNIANTTCYENIYPLNGSLENALVEEIDGYNIEIQIDGVTSEDLEIKDLNVLDSNSLQKITNSLNSLNRDYCGAKYNQLKYLYDTYIDIYNIIKENYNLETTKKEVAKQALSNIKSILDRIKQLVEMAGSSILGKGDIESLNKEINILLETIDLLANNIKIDNTYLLNGNYENVQNVNLNGLGRNGQKLEINIDTDENIDLALSDIEYATGIIDNNINNLQ